MVNFYPPVDGSRFKADPALRAAARREFGMEDAELVVGTIGNVNRQKGHDSFIRAAAQLKAKVKGAKFLIFGAMHDNHRDYIEQPMGSRRPIGAGAWT